MKTEVIYFSMAPSVGVVCLMSKMQKAGPGGAMQEAETWSRGIFFQCVKTEVVYFTVAPPIGGVCLVTKTQKRVLVEPGAMQEAETWSRGIFFQCVRTWVVYFQWRHL